jgi:hypothetical protein
MVQAGYAGAGAGISLSAVPTGIWAGPSTPEGAAWDQGAVRMADRIKPIVGSIVGTIGITIAGTGFWKLHLK